MFRRISPSHALLSNAVSMQYQRAAEGEGRGSGGPDPRMGCYLQRRCIGPRELLDDPTVQKKALRFVGGAVGDPRGRRVDLVRRHVPDEGQRRGRSQHRRLEVGEVEDKDRG